MNAIQVLPQVLPSTLTRSGGENWPHTMWPPQGFMAKMMWFCGCTMFLFDQTALIMLSWMFVVSSDHWIFFSLFYSLSHKPRCCVRVSLQYFLSSFFHHTQTHSWLLIRADWQWMFTMYSWNFVRYIIGCRIWWFVVNIMVTLMILCAFILSFSVMS